MGTPEEIAAKQQEIADVKLSIKNSFLLGKKYKVENSKSNRETETHSLKDLREYLVFLEAELKTLQGNAGGFVGTF